MAWNARQDLINALENDRLRRAVGELTPDELILFIDLLRAGSNDFVDVLAGWLRVNGENPATLATKDRWTTHRCDVLELAELLEDA
jgi:hypothetical protein